MAQVKAWLVLFFFLLCSLGSFSQIPGPPKGAQSPNMMSLGLFGEVPVSYFTGVPNINVPLYDFTENGISIPLGLSYHASGFRPDVHPGWVGINWNLSASYAISRTIRDVADDYISPAHVQSLGYYYSYNYVASSSWNTTTFINTRAGSLTPGYDTEPDEFSFSYPGGYGKFYLNHKREWKVKSDRPVRVIFNGDFTESPLPVHFGSGDRSKFFAGFTVIDEFGNKYLFGYNSSAVEYSISFYGHHSDEWSAQAWYLTKIIHANGYEVNLEYERDRFINQMYFSATDVFTAAGGTFGTLLKGWRYDFSCSSGVEAYVPKSYGGRLISPVYLSSIKGSGKQIKFKRSATTEMAYTNNPASFIVGDPYWHKGVYEPSPIVPLMAANSLSYDFQTCLDTIQFKQLDSIQVFDSLGNMERFFKLTYSNSTSQRLRLLTVQETGRFGVTKPPFKFSYTAFPGGTPEPPYLSGKTDHWGFFNNYYADFDAGYSIYTSSRQPDSTVALYGTIKSITYPTGGVTEFVFEPHLYTKWVKENRGLGLDSSATNKLAGGLRIRKILSSDSSTLSVKKTKEYLYVKNYNSSTNISTAPSSGVLGTVAKYFISGYQLHDYVFPSTTITKSVYSSQTLLPNSENSAGSHMGYSEVVEKASDGGYTKYTFTNFDNGRTDSAGVSLQTVITPYEPFISCADDRGKVLKEENYASPDVLVSKTETDYIALNKSQEFVRAIKATAYFDNCDNAQTWYTEGTAYGHFTYSYLPKSIITTSYQSSGVDPIIEKQYLFYNDTTRLLIKDSAINSSGEAVCSYYRYPTDISVGYAVPSGASVAHATGFMKQNGIWGAPIEIIRTRKISGVEYVTNATLTRFKGWQHFVAPYESYSYSAPTSMLAYSSYSKYAVTAFSANSEVFTKDSRLELRNTISNYDLRGNVLTSNKDQDINTAFQWGNNYSGLVAKVNNGYNNKVYSYTALSKTDSLVVPLQNTGISYTYKIRHQFTGDIILHLSSPTSTTYTAYSIYLLKDSTVQSFGLGLNSSTASKDTFTSVSPGLYTLIIKKLSGTETDKMNLTITYNSAQSSVSSASQFYYEGFEDSIASGVTPFAGNNCKDGDFTVPYTAPAGGVYKVDYRYLDAGAWKYKKVAYTNGMTLTDGTAIDEVRVYRTDMQIATYTYDTNNGLTSQNDVNGKTEKYTYDGLGRLIVVKDDQENILKRICYTYYGQTQNCAIDTSAKWEFTNDKRCKPCAFNPAYKTLTSQKLKRNINANSPSFNDTMWVDNGIDSTCLMTIPTGWVQTATALTCQKNGTNNNTGYTIREDLDTAKCSYTYNQTRLVVHNYNTTMCPINSVNIRMTSPYTLSGGYITFVGTAGTFTFYFPSSSTSNYLLGTIPGDVYNVTINSGGSSYTFTANGTYAFYGSSNTISGLMVGGTNWTLGAN